MTQLRFLTQQHETELICSKKNPPTPVCATRNVSPLKLPKGKTDDVTGSSLHGLIAAMPKNTEESAAAGRRNNTDGP